MRKKKLFVLVMLGMYVALSGCQLPMKGLRQVRKNVPASYKGFLDTLTIGAMKWRDFYKDTHLVALIDTALSHNQELNIMRQEVEVARYEVKERKAEYLPFLYGGMVGETEKPGLYTRNGAVEHQLEGVSGHHFPEPMQNYGLGLSATWELDIWRKLRNAKDAVFQRFLATEDGKNFLVTNLVAEIAEAYYELMALDNLLDIIETNSEIQGDALRVVRQQMQSAKVTQLAVNRFEAQWLNTQNRAFAIRQRIVEVENRLRYLTGQYGMEILRSSANFLNLPMDSLRAGVPSQLLKYRPDVRQAERELAASGLDVKVARAQFYPSLGIRAGVGLQAFNPSLFMNPGSLIFNLAGDLVAPLVNFNALKAALNKAKAHQVMAAYRYEQSLLNAYVDVLNQLAKIENFENSFQKKSREVEILKQSITIANNLFNSARADYAEVLLTQREALEAKMELVEIRLKQLQARIHLYRALGGGWR